MVRPRSRSPLYPRLRVAVATTLAVASFTSIAPAADVSAPAMIQFFESTWTNTQRRAPDLFMAGYGQIWIPPAARADSGPFSVGYDVRDRFDLGSADNPTLYGTENTLKRSVVEMRRAGLSTYADLVWNHNGFSTYADSGFANSGGYPGFVAADFHATNIDVNNDQYNGRTSGLIDIAQESTNFYVRTPFAAGANNIPAGTFSNKVVASNQRLYQNRDRAPDRVINGVNYWNFTPDTATTGDAVSENAIAYLQRNAQWMIQEVGVDGFRLDATKHMPAWVLNDYLDPAVAGANPRLNLDGSVKQVFSFGENFDGGKAYLQTYIRKDTTGNLVRNRDTKDFPLYFALQSNLTANGLANDWRNVVNASVDSQDDGIANNGSQGVGFVQSADSFGPELSNVGYAFSLMRPGNQLVYFNAQNFAANREFPKAGRGDALGGQYGDTITRLVGLRNTHGRGNYLERYLTKETLVYERDKSAVVALSNRVDGGYDNVTVQTNFNAGTRLLEMTGNATDASVDPTNVIADYVVVDGSGRININIPRNQNVNGGAHNKGYVVYGLPTPQGTLSIPDRATTIAGGTATATTNGTTRLAALDVITGNSFTINMVTTPVVIGGFTDVPAGGDNALFSINGGRKADGSANDLNGTGLVDYRDPSNDVVYGFEEFKLNRSPLATGGSGIYRQVIDATKLVEGFNYLEVRAFRQRPAGEPAVYSSFKKVVYVDRFAATSALTEVRNVGGNDRAVRLTQADGTADNVHAFLDLGLGLSDAAVLAMVNGGSGSSQLDSALWSKTFGNVGSGNHTLTLVTYEPSGRATVQRQAGLVINTGRGAGLGDVNYDGAFTSADVTNAGSFDTFLYSRGALFNAASDLNADGKIDDIDLFALPARFTAVGASASTLASVRSALTRRGNLNGDAITSAADIDFLFAQIAVGGGDTWLLDLNVDNVVNKSDVDVLVQDLLFTAYGDANLDRRVNFSDLLALAAKYNTAGTWSNGDFDGSGVVEFGDLLLLAKNYNFDATAATSATLDPAFSADWALAQAIAPEPGVALSALVMSSAIAMRRRRRTGLVRVSNP